MPQEKENNISEIDERANRRLRRAGNIKFGMLLAGPLLGILAVGLVIEENFSITSAGVSSYRREFSRRLARIETFANIIQDENAGKEPTNGQINRTIEERVNVLEVGMCANDEVIESMIESAKAKKNTQVKYPGLSKCRETNQALYNSRQQEGWLDK